MVGIHNHQYNLHLACQNITCGRRVPLGLFKLMTMQLYVLDYGAGNVQSLGNALTKLGYEFKYVKDMKDFALADKVIFPGVGNFGEAMQKLENMGIVESLKEYIAQNRPFMGICVGLQCLFESSAEAPNLCGLSIIPAKIQKFDSGAKSVPHIGWNFSHSKSQESIVDKKSRYYFVHSYAAIVNEADMLPEKYQSWIHTLTAYGSETFVSTVKFGNVFATQFHPEKSGNDGLALIDHFLKESPQVPIPQAISIDFPADGLSKRIIACLDVRANDNGELVVTKGDQYDVREEAGNVRNMGNPMEMAAKYFEQGADEIVFLNITSFREYVPGDNLMLSLLKQTSKKVFVPLTIGGGIRDMKSPDGKMVTAFQVAEEYFRSGADKVSIGSDAVYITQRYLKEGSAPANAISSISKAYGAQAVVVSVDPRMVYVSSPDSVPHSTCKAKIPGPNGEQYWFLILIQLVSVYCKGRP